MSNYADLPGISLGDVGTEGWADQVRDNFDWVTHRPNAGSQSGAPAARLGRASTEAGWPSGSGIPFLNADTYYNRGGLITVSGAEATLIVPTGGAGIYEIGGAARLACTYAGSGSGEVGISLAIGAATLDYVSRPSEVGSGSTVKTHRLSLSTEYLCAEGDYIQLVLLHTNQSNVDVVSSGAYSPVLWARWMGHA